MLKTQIFLLILLLVVGCGKKSTDNESGTIKTTPNPIQRLGHERIIAISTMPISEFEKEAVYPLVTRAEVESLYELIFTKLNSGSKAQDLEPYVWLMLDGIHRNWEKDDKKSILKKLDTLASQDEVLLEMVNLFLESEGLRELAEIKSSVEDVTDANKKLIVERRKELQVLLSLDNKDGISLLLSGPETDKITEKAIDKFIRKSISSESIGQPVKFNFPSTKYELPTLHWKGSLYSEFAGSKAINSDYVEGNRFGANKDWASTYGGDGGHSFLTVNMATKNSGDSVEYSMNLISEVRGGGKKTSTGGFKDKSATARFDLTGQTIIPGCDDIRACSPFVEIRIQRFQPAPNTSIKLLLNNVVINGNNALVDRTQGQSILKILIKGNRYHSGKSGEIADQLALNIQLIQKDLYSPYSAAMMHSQLPANPIEINLWVEEFDKGLMQALMDGNAGNFIFRHLKYLDSYSKLQQNLSPTQVSTIKILNNYIITEADARYLPVINKLIEEKKRTILRLPLDEMSQIFHLSLAQDLDEAKFKKNNDQIKVALIKAGLNYSFPETSNPKKYLMVSFYKKLSDSLTSLSVDLKDEITSLQLELAQIKHLQHFCDEAIEDGVKIELH